MIISKKEWFERRKLPISCSENYSQTELVKRWYIFGVPILTNKTIYKSNL